MSSLSFPFIVILKFRPTRRAPGSFQIETVFPPCSLSLSFSHSRSCSRTLAPCQPSHHWSCSSSILLSCGIDSTRTHKTQRVRCLPVLSSTSTFTSHSHRSCGHYLVVLRREMPSKTHDTISSAGHWHGVSESPETEVIEAFVNGRIRSSPLVLKLREDVDRLQKHSIHYEASAEKLNQAIKDSEDVNSANVKKINRTLKSMERTLANLYDRQSEADHGPLSKEIIGMKPHGKHLMKRMGSQQPPDIPPARDMPLTQPSTEPSTSWAHTEESILNTGQLTQDFSSSPPSPSPLTLPLPPSPLPSPLSSPSPFAFPLPLPSPSPVLSSSPPPLPQEETHDNIPPPQVTCEMGTTLINSSLKSSSTDFCGTVRLWFFVLWLLHWVEAGNAYLGACLDYGGRHTRTLLNRIFALHPLLTRVYLIMESTILSLHTATLLLTCVLYIQEAILLATQMEPERTIA